MIRARKLSNVHKKRSIRPLYSHHQATPYASFLDTASVTTTVVSPGMVATRIGVSERMGIPGVGGVSNVAIPFGLFANFINGDMDELGDGTEIGVWRGGPDATFEVLSDALSSNASWTAASTANQAVFYGKTGNFGKLTLAGLDGGAVAGTDPTVARLIEAPSNNKIIIHLDLSNRLIA